MQSISGMLPPLRKPGQAGWPAGLSLLLMLALFVISGCAPSPSKTPAQDSELQRALQSKDPSQIAQGWWRAAAREDMPQRAQYQLNAIETAIDAGLDPLAERFLNEQRDRAAWSAWPKRAQLIRGYEKLRQKQAVEALNLIRDIPAPLDEALARRRLALLAETYLALDLPFDSVRQRIALEALLSNPEDVDGNRRQLWSTLNTLPAGRLAEGERQFTDEPLAGWIALARLWRTQPLMIDNWRKTHATHPASGRFLDLLLETQPPVAGAPLQPMPAHPQGRIALLLPLQGRYAPVAKAVQEGFMAAARPAGAAVVVYDSGMDQAALEAAYRRAVAEGASAIIGPLIKEQVAQLGLVHTAPIPLIALNTPDVAVAPPPNSYRLSLNPEDEARAAAERMIQDGHYDVLALVPATPQGERLLTSFETRLRALGGQLIDTGRYSENEHVLTEVLRPLLRAETQNLRQQTPQIRQDATALFLVANSRRAAEVMPQLAYYGAARLPVYATSAAYDGLPKPTQDREKQGLIFAETPLVLAGALPPDDPAYNQFEQAAFTGYPRLYALGLDSFAVLGQLERLGQRGEVEGQTGTLTLENDGILRRQPVWAVFQNGYARPLGALPEMSAPALPGPSGGMNAPIRP